MQIQSLERIRQLRGMDEFKALAERLMHVAENKARHPMSRIQLPNYLFIEAPGCGVTTHIRMLTDLLYELNLTPFEGERRCFEWVLDRNAFSDEASVSGNAFDQLLKEMLAMAGFHESFCGVIGLEMDDWQRCANSRELTRLFDLVDDRMGQIVFVFVVQQQENGDPDALIHRISAEMPLEVVHCPLPSADDMAQYLADFLRRRHFSVAPGTAEAIRAFIPALMKTDVFDGFQTLDNLADEIVYRFCAGSVRADVEIGPEDVAFVCQPGGYIDRLSKRTGKKRNRPIGFRSEGEWYE